RTCYARFGTVCRTRGPIPGGGGEPRRQCCAHTYRGSCSRCAAAGALPRRGSRPAFDVNRNSRPAMDVVIEIWKLLDGRQRRRFLLVHAGALLMGVSTLMGIAA